MNNSNRFMSRRNLIFLAVLLASSAAQADVVTVTGADVTLLTGYNRVVNDTTKASGGSVANPPQLSSGTLGRFDATLGVLTNAVATSTILPGIGFVKGGGSGSAYAYSTWSLGGNSFTSTLANVANTGTYYNWSPINLTSSTDKLDYFVGSGNIATNSFSSYLSVNWSSGTSYAFAQSGTGQSSFQRVDLVSSESVVYTYLNHANASFTSGLDTNTLTQDVSGGASSFSLYNLGTANTTVKLDFESVSCISGDCAAFALSPPSFADLAAGIGSGSGSIGLATANAGAYQAVFELGFSDDQVGAISSRRENSLTLNVNGTVAAAIPEPDTYAMILSGLGFMGFLARRRKKMETA